MNLILITIDCLRADHLSCLGYYRKTTPNLDELASTGALFTQAISASSFTPPSFNAMFTSTYPLMHDGQLYISDSTTTLAQILREKGYITAAFHANPWLSSFSGYQKGFDVFDDGIQKRTFETLMNKPRKLLERVVSKKGKLRRFLAEIHTAFVTTNFVGNAEILNNKVLSWLDTDPRDFFLWIHYMDVHEPYLPASRYTSPINTYRTAKLNRKAYSFPDRLSPQELNTFIDLYDSKVSYLDTQISSLLHSLRQSNKLHDTNIIVTADHGQQFMEHGHTGHGYQLYDELLHVPLIISGPEVEGQVISRQVSLLDLAPTISDLLKVEKPEAFLGNSLLPLVKGDQLLTAASAAISETDTVTRLNNKGAGIKLQLDARHRRISIRTGKWKYIYTEGGGDELYDLENDSKEINNIIDTELKTAAVLRDQILAHIEFEEKSAPDEKERIKAKIKRLKESRRI